MAATNTSDLAGDIPVLELRGEHDLSTADDLDAELRDAFARGLPAVVDLTEATFIDSTILRVLFDALRIVHEGDLELALVLPPEGDVRRMFEVAGVLSAFSVHPSRERALAHAALWAHR